MSETQPSHHLPPEAVELTSTTEQVSHLQFDPIDEELLVKLLHPNKGHLGHTFRNLVPTRPA